MFLGVLFGSLNFGFIMGVVNYFGVAAMIGFFTSVLGLWLKARLNNSIKHEYDKVLEFFKIELKRSDALLGERFVAFRSLSGRLLALRRYCSARIEELRSDSEFAPRTEFLGEEENISLLSHHGKISNEFDGYELFLSHDSRRAFDELFLCMNMGFSMELHLFGGNSLE